jgi:GTP-binding protein
MPNILAIVGRPNVGKSTLFNRILKERSAIVHDLPGVTRDRHYGTSDWNGKVFTLIDTGGFVPESDDVFERAIREQAKIAIEESKAVVFLVDATAGVTLLDREIATVLRRASKTVYLVVNKIDSAKRESEIAQFFELGFGEPLSIGALGGRKIGDFLDVVTKDFSAAGDEDVNTGTLKLAIVGRPNVGKSSLVNALLGKDRQIVTEIPGTTRDAIDTVLRYQGQELLLIDTAGLRRKSKIKESIEFYSTIRSLKSIDRCDVALLVIDVSGGVDKQDLRILTTILEQNRAAVLVGNKWDLVEKDNRTAESYEKHLRDMMRMYAYLPIIFISAREKQRVFKVIELAKQINDEQNRRIPTNRLNKVVLEAVERRPPAAVRGKEIRIQYVTQARIHPPTFVFFSNEPKLIETRYRRYLERMLREEFGFTGVPLVLLFRKKN